MDIGRPFTLSTSDSQVSDVILISHGSWIVVYDTRIRYDEYDPPYTTIGWRKASRMAPLGTDRSTCAPVGWYCSPKRFDAHHSRHLIHHQPANDSARYTRFLFRALKSFGPVETHNAQVKDSVDPSLLSHLETIAEKLEVVHGPPFLASISSFLNESSPPTLSCVFLYSQ